MEGGKSVIGGVMLEPAEVSRWERLTAAMIRHAGADDPEGFAMIVRVLDEARAKLPQAAAALQTQGYSWGDIGRALGVTRSAAYQRFNVAEVISR